MNPHARGPQLSSREYRALPGGAGAVSDPLGGSLGGFEMPQAGGGDQHADIFRTIHRRLRGRYVLGLVLGAICAAAGGAAGYFTQKPMYKCETTVRVVMFDAIGVKQDQDYQNRINQFQTIISTQASYIQSPRVLARAMDSADWAALGRPRTPEVEQQFRDALKVIPQRDSPELISVAFQDADPVAARAGLMGVVYAYDDIVVKVENSGVDRSRLALLEGEQRDRREEIKRLESEIADATKEFSTSDVSIYQSALIDQIMKIRGTISELEIKLANAGLPAAGSATAGSATPGSGTPQPPKPMTAYEIASAGDEEMLGLIATRRGLDAKLDNALAGGATEANREVVRLRNLIETSDKKIREAVEKWNKEGGNWRDGLVTGTTRPETPEQMVARLKRLKAQRDVWEEEAKGFKGVNQVVEDKRKQISDTRAKLGEVEDALTSIRTKMRIKQDQPLIQLDREIPTPRAPAFDRRKKIGALGFMLGGMLPFGLIALYGMIDRRFRYSDQTSDPSIGLPLLGILPELPSDLSDPEEAAAAAHCVHQMRTMLQISGEDRKVYAITSATSGDGKTCLTLSLGLSFAAAGSKTLLVDFDLVGQGLSSKLKIRPEHGMASSLETGQPGDAIVATKIDRLFLLPAGRHDEDFVSRLSRPMVKQIIDEVRAEYDIIIIDTGPVLGSLEANFVTSQAEGVVLVVGRNQQRSLVQRAEQQLISLGARIIGQVFNRALSTDFRSSMSSASMRSTRSTPAHPVTAIQVARVDSALLELDPVSRTVALDIRR